jgi:hypothetical protein
MAGLASIRLGQSLTLLPTPHSGTFCQPWSLLRKALLCPLKRRKQPERYTQFFLKFVQKYKKHRALDKK